MEKLAALPGALWTTMAELAPSLFLGLLIAGLLHVLINRDRIFAHLGKPGIISSMKASMWGVPLPLCSCGVLPAALGLRRDGASRGATTSFLVSTPQTGVDSLLVTAGMLGWPFALAKLVTAFAAGVTSGTLVDAFPGSKTEDDGFSGACTDAPGGFFRRLWDFSYRVVFLDIHRWLTLGIVVSGLIVVLVPPGYLADVEVLNGPLGLLAALLVGIPMYVCSVASVPIAAGLIYAGFPVGGALVFLMAGPATNAATMGAVRKAMGGRAFWIYLLTIIGFSMAAGLLLNRLQPLEAVAGIHHDHIGLLPSIAAGVLLLGLAAAWLEDLKRWMEGRAMDTEDALVLRVGGMTCQGCASRVRQAVRPLDGVEDVLVDLSGDSVRVLGSPDPEAVREAIREAGYTVEENGE
ncbi:MAG: permease [Candidatus Fermentibacteraceae bacterium]